MSWGGNETLLHQVSDGWQRGCARRACPAGYEPSTGGICCRRGDKSPRPARKMPFLPQLRRSRRYAGYTGTAPRHLRAYFPLPLLKNLRKAHLTLVLILIDFSSIFSVVMMDAADESADGVGK